MRQRRRPSTQMRRHTSSAASHTCPDSSALITETWSPEGNAQKMSPALALQVATYFASFPRLMATCEMGLGCVCVCELVCVCVSARACVLCECVCTYAHARTRVHAAVHANVLDHLAAGDGGMRMERA
jgi:hypothetical protein